MAVRETAGHLVIGARRQDPRVPRNPERLRPPLHLLRHSLRTRQFALRPDGDGRRARAHACRIRHRRGRADRRRPHRLRRRPSRCPHARRARRVRSCAPSPNCRAFACRPSIRSRSTTASRRDRQRAAPDAPLPPVAPARQRPDPEAHEAPPQRAPTPSASPRRCGACARTSFSAPT